MTHGNSPFFKCFPGGCSKSSHMDIQGNEVQVKQDENDESEESDFPGGNVSETSTTSMASDEQPEHLMEA